MRRTAKRNSYHHGDLRAALIDTAVELIGEHGVRGFSLAEASRRLGVAVSAPYRHFADRDELVVAAGVRACRVLAQAVTAESAGVTDPARRLAAAAAGYVRFAVEHRPLFDAFLGSRADGPLHPELEQALEPVKDTFGRAALALSGGDPAAAERLAVAVAATAHGHAELARQGAFDTASDAGPDTAIIRTGQATEALVAGRAALRS